MKVVGVLLCMPSFLSAGCVDAFPERCRVVFSRVFFTVNLGVLGMLFFAVTSGVSDLDDVTFSIYGKSVALSTIAMSAIGNLVPFGAENLMFSLLHPGSLAVLQSHIVSVKVDCGVLEVLQAAQRLLISEGKS